MKDKWHTYLFVKRYFEYQVLLSTGGGQRKGGNRRFSITSQIYFYGQSITVAALLVLCGNYKLMYILG